MLKVEEAIKNILGSVKLMPPEEVGIAQALNRILAEAKFEKEILEQ